MKSKWLFILLAVLLVTACGRPGVTAEGNSFRAQLCELVQLRDTGAISEREYDSSKRQILSLMLH